MLQQPALKPPLLLSVMRVIGVDEDRAMRECAEAIRLVREADVAVGHAVQLMLVLLLLLLLLLLRATVMAVLLVLQQR